MQSLQQVSGCAHALVGRVIEGLYPAANYRGVNLRLERRRVRVEHVRDLESEPLDPVTVELDPGLRRGSTLIRGFDLDKGAERSFYLDSFAEVRVVDGDDDSWIVSVGNRTILRVHDQGIAEACADGFNHRAANRRSGLKAVAQQLRNKMSQN